MFARSWREYVGERARLQYFPAMAAQAPELRRTFLHRRVFLNARTLRFDLALLAAAGALWRGSPLALVGSIPYLRALRSHANRARGRGRQPSGTDAFAAGPGALEVALADAAADVTGLAALLYGSAHYRSLVL